MGNYIKRTKKAYITMYLYILCLTCFKNCPISIRQYMEPDTKCFMCSTSSYSTLLPTCPSLRTIGHATQLTQKPSSTFKSKIANKKKHCLNTHFNIIIPPLSLSPMHSLYKSLNIHTVFIFFCFHSNY